MIICYLDTLLFEFLLLVKAANDRLCRCISLAMKALFPSSTITIRKLFDLGLLSRLNNSHVESIETKILVKYDDTKLGDDACTHAWLLNNFHYTVLLIINEI